MTSDHIMPVVRNWIAGFFVATLTVVVPISAVYSERVKPPYQGLQPKDHGCTETSTKRSLSIVDASHCLRIPS